MENNKSDEVAYLLKLRSQIEDRIRELSVDVLVEFELQKLVENETSCEESNSNKNQSDMIIIENCGYLLLEGTINSCKDCCFYDVRGYCTSPNPCDRECDDSLIYKRACVTCGKAFEDYAVSCQCKQRNNLT